MKDRTAAINRLHSAVEKIRCGYHTRIPPLTSTRGLDAAVRLLRGDPSARAAVATDRIAGIRRLDRAIAKLTDQIAVAVTESATSLTGIYGVGPLIAADIVAEVGDPARFATKARFAAANGTAPSRPAHAESSVTGSTAAATDKSTERSTSPPSPRSADPAPKAAPTTSAASTAAKANEKPSEPSNGASQTGSGPASKPTSEHKTAPSS